MRICPQAVGVDQVKRSLTDSAPQPGGVAQRPMKVQAGEIYRGSLWIRGEAPAGLQIQLMGGDDVLALQAIPAPSERWTEMPIALKPTNSSDSAALAGTASNPSRSSDKRVFMSVSPVGWGRL